MHLADMAAAHVPLEVMNNVATVLEAAATPVRASNRQMKSILSPLSFEPGPGQAHSRLRSSAETDPEEPLRGFRAFDRTCERSAFLSEHRIMRDLKLQCGTCRERCEQTTRGSYIAIQFHLIWKVSITSACYPSQIWMLSHIPVWGLHFLA